MTKIQFLKEVKAYAKEANVLYFNGELDLAKINFVISERMFRTLGWASYKYNVRLARMVYGIKLAFLLADTPADNWHNTVVHEMVHIWQYMHGYMDHHGETFQMKAAMIRRIDPMMNIERLCNLNHQHNKAVKDKVLAARAQRSGSNKTQYMVSREGRFFFITNIKPKGVSYLQKKGYTVFRLKEQLLRVRNTKNVEFLVNESRYYEKATLLAAYPNISSQLVKLNPTKG